MSGQRLTEIDGYDEHFSGTEGTRFLLPADRRRSDRETSEHRAGQVLCGVRSDREQSSCRPSAAGHGHASHAEGRAYSDRAGRRRDRPYRGPLRQEECAADDDARNHRRKCRLSAEAAFAFHQNRERRSAFREQCGLALQDRLYRYAARGRNHFQREPHDGAGIGQVAP